MKRFMSFIIALMVSVSVSWAQQSAVESKSEGFLLKALDKASGLLDSLPSYEDYNIELPEYEEITPYPIPAPTEKPLTKKEIIDDMNYMWSRLVDMDDITVLVSDNMSDMKWDFSGNTLYVIFSDEIFDTPRLQRTVAYYARREDNNAIPTQPSGKNIFPVIFVRKSALELDRLVYTEYMRDVLAHEMLHYAIDRVEDFEVSHSHDEVFLDYANGWNKELADLDINIKPYADSYEINLLIK